MNYLIIDTIYITKTNIRSSIELSDVYIKYIFNNYFNKDCINCITIPDITSHKFPIKVEFKKIIINSNLNSTTIDKIYEFNRYLKDKEFMKFYVDLNEIWTITKANNYMNLTNVSDINENTHIIKDKNDELNLIKMIIEKGKRDMIGWNIDSKMNLTQIFIQLMTMKTKYELAEMLGGILDEDDYFVSSYRQTADMYKKYVARKYKYTRITPSIIDEIDKNLSRFNKESQEKKSIIKPLPIKRQCTDNELFERNHGISFEESNALIGRN